MCGSYRLKDRTCRCLCNVDSSRVVQTSRSSHPATMTEDVECETCQQLCTVITVHSTYKHIGYKHAPVICTASCWSRLAPSHFNGKQLRL